MTPRELIDCNLAKIRLGHARRARGQSLDRLPARFRHRALSRRLRLSGRQVPLQAGLADRAVQALAPDHGPPSIPSLPDHWEVIEEADSEHPFRLATSPARGFLNSSFTETPTSLARERRPDGDDPSGRRRARSAIGDGEEVSARQPARHGAAARASCSTACAAAC